MARYAIELLTNQSKWTMFGKAARKRAVEQFDVHKIVDQYENYYQECLAGFKKQISSESKIPQAQFT
jgi:glycosyltransferase involved in cell wall biosynthesis